MMSSEASPVAPPKKKQKLRIPLKKKPADKSPTCKATAPRSVRIQEPVTDPAPRRPIDTTNMVVEARLASKPPRRVVPPENRSKSRHDPNNLTEDQPEADTPPAKVLMVVKPRTTIAK